MEKQQLHKKRSLCVGLGMLLFTLISQIAYGQTPYLTENFDGAWSGNPAAPTGWTQTRINYVGAPTIVAPALTTGNKDFIRNVNTAGVWSTAGFGVNPAAAFSGNSALYLEDQSFAPANVTNVAVRRMITPAVDLTTSTNPYIRFRMFFANASNNAYPVKIMASLDNGANWRTIADVAPNFGLVGTAASTTPWEPIAVKIPDAYKTATVRFAIQRSNGRISNGIFIDDFSVEEFTPTTITSAATGPWGSPSTWVGGVVPTANNHVIIAAGHTVSLNQNIARCQSVAIDGTLNHSTTTEAQILQTLDSMNISATGSYLGGNGTTGKFTYIGGSLTNAGTLNLSQSTLSTLYFSGGSLATFTNTGTITAGMIPVIYAANSGGLHFASPVTVRNSFFMTEGLITHNGNLTLGLTGNAITITKHALSSFATRPLFPSLGTALRNVIYGGGTNGTLTYGQLNRDTIFTGFELDTISGTHILLGGITINTQGFVKLTSPLQVGSTTLGGATGFTRGILFTDDVNLLTISALGNGTTFPEVPSILPVPTTHGSYIVGPVRFNRPATGTTTIGIPFGVGAELNGVTPNNNVAKTFSLATGAAWSNQTLTFRLVNTPPTGTGTGVNVIGNRYLTIDLNGGPDLPATASLTFPAMNYTAGTGINTDNLLGTQDQLRVLQNSTPTGNSWVSRSNTLGTGAFIDNTNYPRTTATVALGLIAPLAINGGVFALGTTATKMVYDSVVIVRENSPISIGTVNQMILRVAVHVSGVVPINISNLTFNTLGTTSVANLLNAKVFRTGSSPSFSAANQYGATISTPSGAMSFNGSLNLQNGVNYFWLAYDISPSATLGNTIAANLTSITVDGSVQTATNPPAGGRILSTPMTYVGATARQSVLSKIDAGSVNGRILDIVITMSPTGAPIALNQMNFNTNGTNNVAWLTNAKLFYTGSSNTFNNSTLVGITPAPNGSFTITGNVTLVNGANHFWLTYDIPSNATPNDTVDAELAGFTIAGTPTVNAILPVGFRLIKAPYCAAAATNAGDTDIGRVRILRGNSVLYSNGNALPIQNNPAATGTYSNLTGNTPATLETGKTYSLSMDQITSGANFFAAGLNAFVDWNDDGDFADPGENIFSSVSLSGPNATAPALPAVSNITRNFTVPCNVTNGTYRMRLLLQEGIANSPACGTFPWGEVEDHTISVIQGNNNYVSSSAIQSTGTVSSGVLDRQILRIPVVLNTTACTQGFVGQFNFKTTGTTSNGDIVSAKLYKTGSSASFGTSNLLATIASPGSSFSFVVNDSAINDTNNYWLAYDVSSSAANGNTLDAEIDSILIFGNWVTPTSKNPKGNVLVSSPMTYISSTVEHTNLTKVGRGSTNNNVLRIRVITSSTGAPINATSFNFTSNSGGIDSSNISNAKVFFTGSNANFSAINQFGANFSTVGLTTPVIGFFTINGTQPLLNDTNYFWLTYDIKGGALLGDSVDAELNSFVVDGNSQTPTVSSPAGSLIIRAEYCAAVHTDIFPSQCIANVQFNTLNNNTGTVCPAPPSYSLQNATTTVLKNVTYNLTLTPSAANVSMGVWFDWNDNGTFEVAEYVQVALNQASTNPATIPVIIPCNAVTGTVRMRVRSEWQFGMPFSSTSACTALTYGETEDYIITIGDNPVTYSSSQALRGSLLNVVGQGATDFPVLRLRLKGSGCGVGTTTEIRFNTAATTSAANIINAKLYKTAGSKFNASNLIGTVASPSGQFIFNIVDTLITNDTNNFWLTYDVSSGATSGNILDAAVDSLLVLGTYYVPSPSNPAGTYTIQSPMTFVSSNTVAVTSTKVGVNSANNLVIGYQVEMSAVGAPVDITSITVNTTGTTNLSNITNLRVWYTGNSNSFLPTTQFGSTVNTPLASNVINGVLPLTNGINYFWVTYDIPLSATINNIVDAEVASATINSTVQIPNSTSATGDRMIRAEYCPAPYTTGKTFGDLISRIRIIGTTLDNNSGTAPVNPAYTYFTGQPNLTATLIQGSIYQVEVTIGSFAGQGIAAWVDYNDDGIFQASERIGFTAGRIGTAFGTATFPIALTCAATPGVKRLRIRENYNMNGNLIDPCASYAFGECEDYDITIGVNPGVYGSSSVIQVSGTVPPGATNAPLLRIPVTATGCTSITTNSFNFTSVGTTNMSDIVAAKIYKTGNSTVFSANNLVGSLLSPTSTFSISAVDTLLNGFTDTNNYWLAVDVSPSATTFNTIDAQLPTLIVDGTSRVPSNTNPSGNLVIQSPMVYQSSNTTMPNASVVAQGSKNQVMARIMVITGSSGAPIPLTSIEANTTTLGVSNIDTAEVWYTGNSPFFTSSTQFGSSIAAPSGVMTFTGSQNLNNDTNYFWLTYDLKSSATIGDSVDADVSGIVVAALNYVPTLIPGANNRKIIAPYCETNLHTSNCNGNDVINNVSTTGGLTNINNLNSGCSPAIAGNYAFYNNQTITAYAGGSFTINYQSGVTQGGFRIYADFNQDGDFFDANEEIAFAPISNLLNSTVVNIPITANLGTTRLRVRYASFADVTGPCTNIFQGETEDYSFNIVPLPAPTTYTWNQTVAANFNTASNWTPSRTNPLENDIIVFNGGSNITVTNLPTQTIGELVVANNTTVNFTVSSGILSTQNLQLTSGKFVTNNARIYVGYDTVITGSISGSGTIEGILGRFVNNSTTSLNFPLSQGVNSRAVDLTFTTAPVVSGLITASFIPGTPGTTGLPLTEGAIVANKVAREGIWRLLSSVTGAVFNMSANGTGFTGVSDFQNTVLARRSGNFGAWTLFGTHAVTTGSNAAPVFNRTGYNAFGEYTMIADSNVNPLPVNLVSFDALQVKGDVKLSWVTSSELNNKGFEIERSIDGRNFIKVSFVKGSGNSNSVIRYNSNDNSAFANTGVNTLYYRLKQVDFNGGFTYSNIRIVNLDRASQFEVSAYPVPFGKEFYLSVSSVSSETATIEFYDMQGKLLANKTNNMVEGVNTISIADLEFAKGGVYFVKVTQAGESKMVRVVKTN